MNYREFLFQRGEFFPHADHQERIEKYYENKQIFQGNAWEVFEKYSDKLSRTQKESLYCASNIASLITKKTSDFLFGEELQIKASSGENSPEQKRFDSFVEENNLNITFYENSLTNSFKGDGFFKIRYGQLHNGMLDSKIDPFRIFIQNQPAELVFPETNPMDKNQIIAFHIAYPFRATVDTDEDWRLQVESHYAGYIEYSEHYLTPFQYYEFKNEIASWKIGEIVEGTHRKEETGVPLPLVVHVPNFSLDDGWEGENEIDPLKPLLRALNNHLTFVSKTLEAFSDPILSLPSGSLNINPETGNPEFHPSLHKIIETMEGEPIPQYITWDGNIQQSMAFIDKLIDNILSIAEVPGVTIGRQDSGTSGSSGLAIRFMMSNLLSKVNRKRQYYEKGLSQVFLIAQLLEHSIKGSKAGYEITKPKFVFHDGLPTDPTDESNRISLLVSQGLFSKKSAIMELFGYTEEQATHELERIEKELNSFADPSIFNLPSQLKDKNDISEEKSDNRKTKANV